MMDALAELAELEGGDSFVGRHIGPAESDIAAMLREVGAATLDDLAAQTVPAAIRADGGARPAARDRRAGVIAELRALAARNASVKSLIGRAITAPTRRR